MEQKKNSGNEKKYSLEIGKMCSFARNVRKKILKPGEDRIGEELIRFREFVGA